MTFSRGECLGSQSYYKAFLSSQFKGTANTMWRLNKYDNFFFSMTAPERALVALGDSYLSHQLLISMSLPGTLCMFSCWVVDYACNLSDKKTKH